MKRISEDLIARLDDFQAWRANSANQDKFGLYDYVACIGTPDLFFGFLDLLCPELLSYRGAYFIANSFDESLFWEWWERLGDVREVQKVLNHIDMCTLFQQQAIHDCVADLAAKCIAEVWSKQFQMEGLIAEAYGEGLHGAHVTLFGMDAAIEDLPR